MKKNNPLRMEEINHPESNEAAIYAAQLDAWFNHETNELPKPLKKTN